MSTYLKTLTAVAALALAAPTWAHAQSATPQPQTEVAPQPQTEAAPQAAGDFIATQEADQTRVRQLLGMTVQNAAGERVGDVNDLVLDQSNQVTAVVLGVGGFLGIGEKYVAVPLSKVEMSRSQEGNQVMTVAFTRSELEGAPEFKMIGTTGLRETVDRATKAASETYEKAKEQVREGYDKVKEGVSGQGSTTQ